MLLPFVDPVMSTLYGGASTVLLFTVAATACTLTVRTRAAGSKYKTQLKALQILS
jgi:hypothetical protein